MTVLLVASSVRSLIDLVLSLSLFHLHNTTQHTQQRLPSFFLWLDVRLVLLC